MKSHITQEHLYVKHGGCSATVEIINEVIHLEFGFVYQSDIMVYNRGYVQGCSCRPSV